MMSLYAGGRTVALEEIRHHDPPNIIGAAKVARSTSNHSRRSVRRSNHRVLRGQPLDYARAIPGASMVAAVDRTADDAQLCFAQASSRWFFVYQGSNNIPVAVL